MDVILLKTVERLGTSGERVAVKDGFGRNFLIPQGWAVAATAGNRAASQAALAQRQRDSQLMKEKAKELAQRISSIVCTFPVAVGDQGKLHGAITAGDLSQKAAAQGVSLDKHQIVLPSALTKLGEYSISVKLHPDVTATLQVHIVQQ